MKYASYYTLRSLCDAKKVGCYKQIVVIFFFLMGNIAGKLIALIFTVFFSPA